MNDELERDVPLDREEETARQLVEPDDAAQRDRAAEMLFGTRLRALNPRPPLSVPIGATVADACAVMRANKVGCVLVMDGEELAGIFTERDVLYKLTCTDRMPSEVRIEELMTPRPTTLRTGHRLAHALNKMSVDGCRHIPLVDRDGRPVGVVSVRRIVDFLAERFSRELLTLPPDPDQEMNRAEGG